MNPVLKKLRFQWSRDFCVCVCEPYTASFLRTNDNCGWVAREQQPLGSFPFGRLIFIWFRIFCMLPIEKFVIYKCSMLLFDITIYFVPILVASRCVAWKIRKGLGLCDTIFRLVLAGFHSNKKKETSRRRPVFEKLNFQWFSRCIRPE